jgi:protein O-mannosyl-transferase
MKKNSVESSRRYWLNWIEAAALLAMVLIVYLPVMLHGGFIWDDPEHITRNYTLRTGEGLLAIWVHPTALPQYYPVVHTTFWIEYHLWGLDPTGYHVDNVLLHGFSAILIWRILKKLKIPGALLAAMIFAVHPVNVESVAWATERKNVLSLFFYLVSLRIYLRFLDGDEKSLAISLFFFVLALLSKSVTCSLPAAILLLIYWKNGRIRWADILPLIAFFVVGLAMAIATSLIERYHVGASGREWDISPIDRCLIAGRAVWFYVGKLLWPVKLTFVYPRWTSMSFAQRPWLIIFPLGVLGVLALLWGLRNHLGRGPLVAVLFFVETLLPALGFINVYPMRYTFVADHYQYQAAIGLYVLAAAILDRWLFTRFFAAGLLVVLGALTWHQQRIYTDSIALWTDTAEKNPDSYMVWDNLGFEYSQLSNADDLDPKLRDQYRAIARDAFAKLLKLAPNEEMSHWKWGIVIEFDGDLPGAVAEFQKALDINPKYTPAMDSMGLVLMRMDQPQKAMKYYRRAIELDPKFAEVRYHYGIALEKIGDTDAAEEQYAKAVQLKPNYAEAEYNLASILLKAGREPGLAASLLADAVQQHPNRAEYHTNFAVALYDLGRFDEARAEVRIALQLNPNLAPAQALFKTLQ